MFVKKVLSPLILPGLLSFVACGPPADLTPGDGDGDLSGDGDSDPSGDGDSDPSGDGDGDQGRPIDGDLPGDVGTGGEGDVPGDGDGAPREAPPEAVCEPYAACGGDILGAWEVTSSCLEVNRSASLVWLGIGCETAEAEGSLEVTGTLEVLADGTYLDNTRTRGVVEFELAKVCREISGTVIECDALNGPFTALGLATTVCTRNADTDGCSCVSEVDQIGGLGNVSPSYVNPSFYQVSTSGLMVSSNAEFLYDFCSSPSFLALSPKGEQPISATGTVVLAPAD